MIEESLQLCDWVKLNEDELARLRDLLDVKDSQPCGILFELRERYDIQLAALTRGGRGCLVQSADEEIDLPGEQVAVVDTIGAGDAFTAGLVVKMLEGRSLRQAALFANRFAGRVAAAAGGTPTIARDEIDYLANE
jgi:fructokinase